MFNGLLSLSTLRISQYSSHKTARYKIRPQNVLSTLHNVFISIKVLLEYYLQNYY